VNLRSILFGKQFAWAAKVHLFSLSSKKRRRGSGRGSESLSKIPSLRLSPRSFLAGREGQICRALFVSSTNNLRFAIFIAAIVLAGSSLAKAEAASADQLFRDGVAAYQTGDYAKASQEFRHSLARERSAGALLNLGLAKWRQGRAGKAVLSWEQALWIDPYDRDARNNLRFARQVLQINPPDLTWYETASTWLPNGAWAWLAGGSLWLAVAMVTVPGFLRWRKAGWHQGLAALSLGVFLISIPAQIGVVTRSRIGFVLAKDSPLRLTPTEDAETVSTLAPGEPLRKMRERGNYFLVRTEQGTGWVERNQFGLVCSELK